MSLVLLFPGQGSQTTGMLHALPDTPDVRDVLARSTDVLGFDVLTLDSADALTSTVAVQLALVIAGVAFARFLAGSGIRPSAAAGMSVGAFTAAIAADALTLEDGLRLVRRRAELMQQTFAEGLHGMAVIEGLLRSDLEPLLHDTGLNLANDNAPTQFVVAGRRDALEALCRRAQALGAHRAQLLAMAVASHSPALQPAADTLCGYSADVPMRLPTFPVYSNKTARPLRSGDQLREDLVMNMAWPVRWRDIVAALSEAGTELYLEAPPGHSLAHLIAANLPGATAVSAAETRWDVLLKAARRVATTESI